jgi:endonuclease-3
VPETARDVALVRRARRIDRVLAETYPDARCELDFRSPFELLVVTVMSAQTTDKRVNSVSPALFAAYPDAAALAAADRERVEQIIQPTGFFRAKAASVMALSQALVDRFDGEVPPRLADLVTLPGVGRKTANVVLNMWWGFPSQPVDTHVFRVGNRTGIAMGADVVAVERALENHVPVEFQRLSHHWLILHGRYTCVARKPKCPACLIRDLCTFEEKTPE